MSILATVYATTEDIAVRASGDFIKLVPKDQRTAVGVDGSILAVSPWVFASTAVDFESLAVIPGDVVALSGPRATPAALRLGEANTPSLFTVESVAGHSLTLRRKGMAAGVGQPAVIADLTGITFEVLTLFPQIERASYQEINERFAIDPALPWRDPAKLYDARQLRDATVLAVLAALYADQSRQSDDVYMKKALMAKAEFRDTIDRMSLRWDRTAGDQPTSLPFGMRMTR